MNRQQPIRDELAKTEKDKSGRKRKEIWRIGVGLSRKAGTGRWR
ncbi:MAG: hypothetical protein U5L72_14580 [Bacteroidales bacterium]|nr:hypothetical protein [Bacteroidales bacterium]